ncbi:hypothetical protein FF2_014884 [Malus domestica]
MDEMGEEVVQESKGRNFGEAMEGVASIALLPCRSLSGHFIHYQDSVNVCFDLQGTVLGPGRPARVMRCVPVRVRERGRDTTAHELLSRLPQRDAVDQDIINTMSS